MIDILAQFELFCNSHLFTLFFFLCVGIVAVLFCRRGYQLKVKQTLGILCLFSFPFQFLAYSLADGQFHLENYIPCHLCDVAAILTGLALLKNHQTLKEIAYFWGLAGTLQGLITPALYYNFPHPIYLSFFWLHGFVVLSALILPLGLGWRPRKYAVWHAFLWLQVYVVIAFTLNAILDTNFAFLTNKPAYASLMDYLSPEPWHLIGLEILALCFFFILSLPFLKIRKTV